jgi:hypothetical protein
MKDKDFDPKILKQSSEQMLEQITKASVMLKERMQGVTDQEEFAKAISKNDIEKKISQLNGDIFSLKNKIKTL